MFFLSTLLSFGWLLFTSQLSYLKGKKIGRPNWPYLQVPVNCLWVTWKLYNWFNHNVHYYYYCSRLIRSMWRKWWSVFSCRTIVVLNYCQPVHLPHLKGKKIGRPKWPYLQVPVNVLWVTWKLYNWFNHNVHYYVLLLYRFCQCGRNDGMVFFCRIIVVLNYCQPIHHPHLKGKKIGRPNWPYLQVPVNFLWVTWKLYNWFNHNVHYDVLLLSIDSVNVAEMMECFSCQDLDPRLLVSSLSSLSCIEKGQTSLHNWVKTC